jgi:hypothetical protein
MNRSQNSGFAQLECNRDRVGFCNAIDIVRSLTSKLVEMSLIEVREMRKRTACWSSDSNCVMQKSAKDIAVN